MALTKITTGVIADGAVPTTGIVGVSTFTSSGTWTKATRESALGVTIGKIIVYVTGGGGGGTYPAGNLADDFGGGGGAGGTAIKIIDVSAISSETVTIGSGGTGSTTNTNGTDGGSSSFGSHCSASGGNGGRNASAGSGLGGIGSSGDLNLRGGVGTGGITNTSSGTNHRLGAGGDSYWGGGGAQASGFDVAETGIYGGGGGGGVWQSGYRSGANGGDGIVVVWEIAG